MSDYTFATFNYTEDGFGWRVEEGSQPDMTEKVNEVIAQHGAPARDDFTQNEKADVLHLVWLGGRQIRLVLHKRPGHERIVCPTCRRWLVPPDWEGVQECHWVPEWRLDVNIWKCVTLTRKGEV